MRAQRVELFAAGAVSPEALWNLVGDLDRLPEWTDADDVAAIEPVPVDVGTKVVTNDGPRQLAWTITTSQPLVLELTTELDRGRLGIGVSVVREQMGARARMILAAAYEPGSSAELLCFRLLGAPALRRRFDRWTRLALSIARRDSA